MRPSRSLTVDSPIRRHRSRRDEHRGPVLRFSPSAWAKLQYLCHAGPTEIGGFGVTRDGDLLYVEYFETIRQTATYVSVSFEDDAVADFFEAQIDAGYQPEQVLRIWAHTHPGDSAEPSMVDEETFERVFGDCDWAVMFILARGGETYARLRFNTGPAAEVEIPVEVDYRFPFEGSDHTAWQEEYERNIRIARIETPQPSNKKHRKPESPDPEMMDPDLPHVADAELDLMLASSMGWFDPWENFT